MRTVTVTGDVDAARAKGFRVR